LLVRVLASFKHVFAPLARDAVGSPVIRRLTVSLAGALLLGLVPALQTTPPLHSHVPATLTAGGGWLARLNLWRTTTGLTPLTENSLWSSGDYNHSLYMVKNDLVTHYETPGVPYYTVDGDTAARNGNIQVSSTTSTTDEAAIDWWMGAPFHAMNMMDPRLTTTGFGSYREVKSGWQEGATLDTIRGNSFSGGTYPVYWPGNGATEPLTNYSGNEFPDPLQACPGYSMPTGLPVFIEVGGNVSTTAGATHTFTGNGVALEHCIIDSSNSAVGSYLYTRGGVIVVPRQPLQNGVTYTVSITVNGAPYTWSFTVGPFAPPPPPVGWQPLGGVLTSGPEASSWGAGRVDAFARGQDNGLWQISWNGGGWSPWFSVGGGLTSDPGAVSWGPNRIDVFARGQDNGLWHIAWNGSAWSGWQPLGGVITTGPAVSSWGANRLDIFARGQDNGLWHMSWNGTSWSGWQSLGGVITSDPTAVSWGPNRIDIFARGQDNGLWHMSWSAFGWSSWESLGGTLTSAPEASSCGVGRLDVFATGAASATYQLGYSGVWSTWKSLGGQATSSPGAVCESGSTTVNLFVRGLNNGLWTDWVSGT